MSQNLAAQRLHQFQRGDRLNPKIELDTARTDAMRKQIRLNGTRRGSKSATQLDASVASRSSLAQQDDRRSLAPTQTQIPN